METIGIFDAKTHLPSLCDKVVASGQPVTVSRRGKPLVVISPVLIDPTFGRESILKATLRWQNENPENENDAELPDTWNERSVSNSSPFEEE